EYRDTNGSMVRKTLDVIDWDEPDNNDYLLVSQLWVHGDYGNKRPDLVAFVNGLPVSVLELKKTGRSVTNAYRYNMRDHEDTLPQLVGYDPAILLSDGADAKVGSVASPCAFYSEWKKISHEEEPGLASLQIAIRGIWEKHRLLDL